AGAPGAPAAPVGAGYQIRHAPTVGQGTDNQAGPPRRSDQGLPDGQLDQAAKGGRRDIHAGIARRVDATYGRSYRRVATSGPTRRSGPERRGPWTSSPT